MTRLNVQFSCTLQRRTSKALLVLLNDGRFEWLPLNGVIAYTMHDPLPPLPSHWFTVSPWLARLKDIKDNRPFWETV